MNKFDGIHRLLLSNNLTDVKDEFSKIEEKDSFSYRKLYLLYLLKSNASNLTIIRYLFDTVKIYPYKKVGLFNNFLLYARPILLKCLFTQIASSVREFIWSDEALKRTVTVMDANICHVVKDKNNNFVCSCCETFMNMCNDFNRFEIINFLIDEFLHRTFPHDSKKRLQLSENFFTWLVNVSQIYNGYTVIIDGANIGRMAKRKKYICQRDIKDLTNYLISQGEKPRIIINEIHKKYFQEFNNPYIIWSPSCINDDICWISLALIKSDVNFITGDNCGDWFNIMNINQNSKMSFDVDDFWVWFNTFKRNISYKNGFVLSEKKSYSRTFQRKLITTGETQYLRFHLPIKNSEEWICWKMY